MDSQPSPGTPPTSQPLVQVVEHRPPGGRPRRWSVLGTLFILAILLFLGVSVLLNMALLFGGADFDSGRQICEEHVSHEKYASTKIAIISLEGMIYDEDGGFVKRQIDQAAEDDDVAAVVLRINSPGGTITGSDYLYHHLTNLREEADKPIVVSMGSLAASGGYYAAMCVGDTPQSIFAEPTTWTGSIGVIVPHYDFSELASKYGVEDDSVVSHPLKNMGSFLKPIEDDERKIWQELVDEGFNRFKDVIKSGRPEFATEEGSAALDELATGQVYTADQALDLGLVDEIGFLEEAVDRAIELAGASPRNVSVVEYSPEPTLGDILLGARASNSPNLGLDLAALLDLSVPRAYFLFTRLPPLVQSSDQ